MLTIGQELYSLTSRDLETLLVEPFFRTINANIGAGASGADTSFNSFGIDRCLYIKNITFDINPGAAQSVTVVSANADSRITTVAFQPLWKLRGTLAGDGNVTQFAGQTVVFNWNADIILPPGAALNCRVERQGTVAAGSYSVSVNGYLIPPGRIGRVF